MNISFNPAPPPPIVDVTVDPVGAFDARSGVATLTGTFTCENGDFADVSVDARQMGVGRLAIIEGFGSFFTEGTCDGKPHPWSAQVFPSSGKFAGGKSRP